MYQYNGDLPFGLDVPFTLKQIWLLDIEYLRRQAFPSRPMNIHTCPIQLINRLNRDDDRFQWKYDLPNELMYEIEELHILSKSADKLGFQMAVKAYDKRRIQYLPDRARKKYDEAYNAYMFMINTLITKPNSDYGTIHKLLGKYPINVETVEYRKHITLEINAATYTREFARTTSLTIEHDRLKTWDIPDATNRVKLPAWF